MPFQGCCNISKKCGLVTPKQLLDKMHLATHASYFRFISIQSNSVAFEMNGKLLWALPLYFHIIWSVSLFLWLEMQKNVKLIYLVFYRDVVSHYDGTRLPRPHRSRMEKVSSFLVSLNSLYRKQSHKNGMECLREGFKLLTMYFYHCFSFQKWEICL